MLRSKWLWLAVGAVAVAVYLNWTPLPDDMDQKGIVRAFGVVRSIVNVQIYLTSLVTDANKFEISRVAGSFIMPSPKLDSDPDLQITNEVFDEIEVRVFRPKSAPVPSPVLMHFHGGGWCLGSIDVETSLSMYLANQTNTVVVSVGYRLAPEHPFPAGLDDCVKATTYVLTHGLDLGLDPTKVGVFGISAGGNLGAAVAIRLLDLEAETPDDKDSTDKKSPAEKNPKDQDKGRQGGQKLPRLSYQVLVCSPFQALDFTLPAYVDNEPIVGGFTLPLEEILQSFLAYAGLDWTSSDVLDQVARGMHVRPETRKDLAKYVHPSLLTDKKTSPASQDSSSGSSSPDSGTVNLTLANLAESRLLSYLVSPALAPDHILKRVPPAIVVMSHYDLLRDDSLLYVRRLRQAGVHVVPHMMETGHHLSMATATKASGPGSEVTLEAYQNIFKFIADRNRS